jgi:hypothetical protein
MCGIVRFAMRIYMCLHWIRSKIVTRKLNRSDDVKIFVCKLSMRTTCVE